MNRRRPRLLALFPLLAGLGLPGSALAAPTPSADVTRAQAQSVADAAVGSLNRRSEAAGERFRHLPPAVAPTPIRLLPPLPPFPTPAPIQRTPTAPAGSRP